jgi:hypothetical protein
MSVPLIRFFYLFIIFYISTFCCPAQTQSGNNDCDALFLDSLEDLLRSQAELFERFEDFLNNIDQSPQEKMNFLTSFEDLLRRQAILYSGFEDLLKVQWDCLPPEEQDKFLASFEDLLKREILLYNSFEELIKKSLDFLSTEEKVQLCRSFEDLLRRQSCLFKSYEELFKMKVGGIFIEKSVDASRVTRGEKVTYTYQVTNWFDKPLYEAQIIDSVLGIVASGFDLQPDETKIFSKETTIKGDVCNFARIIAEDENGKAVQGKSNIVCVTVEDFDYNEDYLVIGNQKSTTLKGDPPVAENKLHLKKTQTSREQGRALVNKEKVVIGSQTAMGNAGESSNTMNLIISQE